MPTFLENCKALGLNPLTAMDNCYPEKCKAGCSDCKDVNIGRDEEDGEKF